MQIVRFLVLLLVLPSGLNAVRESFSHMLVNKSDAASMPALNNVEKQVDDENPNARAWVSQSALDYFSTSLLPVMVSKLNKLDIPDISGVNFKFKWSIKDIHIGNARVESAAFKFSAGRGVLLSLSGIGLDASLTYSASGSTLYNPLRTSGRAYASPKARVIGLVNLGVSEGKPTISLSELSVLVDLGKIQISGSKLGRIVETLVPFFKEKIESEATREIEKAVKNFVNGDLARILAKLDLMVPVPLPEPFENSGIGFHMMGIAAYKDHLGINISVRIGDPKNASHYVRQQVTHAIPSLHDDAKMLSVSLAPEVLEDIVRFHQGKWQYTVQPDVVPKDAPLGLTTVSLGLVTTPSVVALYGKKNMQMTVSLGGPFEVSFDEDVVNMVLPSIMRFDVKHDDKDPEFAFSLQAPINGVAAINVKPEPQSIQGEIKTLTLTPLSTHEKGRGIWWINTVVLSPLVKIVQEKFVLPNLNKLIQGGIPCCDQIPGFALRGLTNSLSVGALTVSSDIELDLSHLL